jgi:hypothetical protein
LKLGASASSAKLVGVKVKVSENLSASSVKLGKGLTISGAVSPSQTGSVKLAIKRNGSLFATRKVSLSSSHYRYTYKAPKTGSYSVVARYPGSATNLGNHSQSRSFKVVR